MIKMMVTVVIVFTVCWLPLNILLVMLGNDESLGYWEGLPYIWFAFHWLAMSHSCYNPIIYCWMNARFRVGFCCALSRVPCLRWLARRLAPGNQSGGSGFGGCTIGGATITHVGGGRSTGPRGRASTSMGPSSTSSFVVSKGNGRCPGGNSRPGSVLFGTGNSGSRENQARPISRRSLRNRDSDVDMEPDEASLLHRVDTGTSYVSVRRSNAALSGGARKSNGEGVNLTDSNGVGREFASGGQSVHRYLGGRHQGGTKDLHVEDQI